MARSNLDFDQTAIGTLLGRGQLTVPPNQRSYAWRRRHVEDLMQDLDEAIESDVEDYFLGTIVLVQEEDEMPSIADGQQRLATSTIVLARVRDQLNEIKRHGSASSIDNQFLRKIDRDTEDTIPRLRLNVEDNEFFSTYILPSKKDGSYSDLDLDKAAIHASNRRLLEASRYIEQFLRDKTKNMRSDAQATTLLKWVDYLEENVAIIVVTVPDEIGAFRMFETLNDRGHRASQADILKNYFLSKAGKRLLEAHVMWNNISATIEAIDDADQDERLVTYLRHLWITDHGPTKERELADEIKSAITGESKTMRFLADAEIGAHDYIALWSSKHQKWAEYTPTTKQYVDTIAQHLRVEQIRPLLFAVARHFSPAEADKAFHLFVSWSVRFLIYGGRGGMLDTQYSRRAHEVGTETITKARELREAMSGYVPTDDEFKNAFASARVSRPYLARYYLRALEKSVKNDPQPEYVANEDVADINLEHILPSTLSDKSDVDFDTAQAARNLLGNMALLKAGQNTNLGNAEFKDKCNVYSKSGYYTTRQIAKYTDWTMADIRDRQTKLAEIAVKTWSLTFND